MAIAVNKEKEYSVASKIVEEMHLYIDFFNCEIIRIPNLSFLRRLKYIQIIRNIYWHLEYFEINSIAIYVVMEYLL